MDMQIDSKTKFLNAAMHVIRAKGFTATRIEDLCEAAELSKGSFFHHFKSKEDLAVAAADHWSAVTGALFAAADYHGLPDPLDRVLGYLALRAELIRGTLPEFTCLAGMMAQEVYATFPAIRDACERSISDHAHRLADDIEAARQRYRPDADWSAESLALYTQATLQGAFVLAKAQNGPEIALDCIAHLTRYIELLFDRGTKQV